MSQIPIRHLSKSAVEGWEEITSLLDLDKEISFSFIRKRDGVQIVATSHNDIIHITIAPLLSQFKNFTIQEIIDYIQSIAPEVIESFFGNIKFKLMPADNKNPHCQHYFGDYHYE